MRGRTGGGGFGAAGAGRPRRGRMRRRDGFTTGACLVRDGELVQRDKVGRLHRLSGTSKA